jgi:hypothetical protein
MKRRLGSLVRDIEQNQARIAALRNDQARIDEEIKTLTMANKTSVMTLVGNAVERLDFGSVAVDDLLSLIAKMAETVGDRSASVAPGTIQAVVRLSRNASVSNRKTLDAAGLRWNGRRERWTGLISAAQLAELRQVFGKRVEKPEEGEEGQDPGSPIDGAQGAVSADQEAIAKPADREQEKAEAAESSTSDATLIPRSPFGGFPVRRSVT